MCNAVLALGKPGGVATIMVDGGIIAIDGTRRPTVRRHRRPSSEICSGGITKAISTIQEGRIDGDGLSPLQREKEDRMKKKTDVDTN
jgi:hypothetical protein